MSQQITITLPTIDQCKISFEYEWENDVRPEDDLQEKDAAWVRSQIKKENMAAWFMAECTCEWKGMKGSSYLGCCSYKSFEEFETAPYSSDMKDEAYTDMVESILALSAPAIAE